MKDEKKESIFHFDDDGEDYDFVLPPEYKISQDNPQHEGLPVEGCDQMEAGDVVGRRVSFDTGRNEYYYVERCSDQETCSDAGDDFRPKEFEIEMLLEQEGEEQADQLAGDVQTGEELAGCAVDASVQSRKPFLEALPRAGPSQPEDSKVLGSEGNSLQPKNAQVVIESLPSIKDNPFILRDRMNPK